MIQIHNLTYRYHNGFTALSDINCSISTGIHLLLGENGAGKTTFMHIIAGLRTPTQGSCLVYGEPSYMRMPSTLSNLFIYTDNMMLPCKTSWNTPVVMPVSTPHSPWRYFRNVLESSA